MALCRSSLKASKFALLIDSASLSREILNEVISSSNYNGFLAQS